MLCQDGEMGPLSQIPDPDKIISTDMGHTDKSMMGIATRANRNHSKVKRGRKRMSESNVSVANTFNKKHDRVAFKPSLADM